MRRRRRGGGKVLQAKLTESWCSIFLLTVQVWLRDQREMRNQSLCGHIPESWSEQEWANDSSRGLEQEALGG